MFMIFLFHGMVVYSASSILIAKEFSRVVIQISLLHYCMRVSYFCPKSSPTLDILCLFILAILVSVDNIIFSFSWWLINLSTFSSFWSFGNLLWSAFSSSFPFFWVVDFILLISRSSFYILLSNTCMTNTLVNEFSFYFINSFFG